MLTPSSTEVIKATLPVVGAAIGEITPIFYRTMFTAHPDLERNLFNRGNQAQGDQQRALAGAIAAYATLLVDENAPAPRDLLARIAHKHVSLGISEDQYAIVHEHLFAAIVQVLGDAVTPEVAGAWDEVYWLMAHDLIDLERGLYTEAGTTPETVWRPVVVTARIQESPDTLSFVFSAADGSQLPAGQPGQYVSVAVNLPDGVRQIRQYSLTRSPGAGTGTWTVSVKAIAASAAEDGSAIPEGEVSNYLHRNVFEGDELMVSPPAGDLILEDDDAPLLLISAGIGATPIIGMLHHLTHEDTRRPVTVLHADRSPAKHAHRAELKDLVGALSDASLFRWYEDLGTRPARSDFLAGLIDLDAVEIANGTQVYLCGPLPFMESVRIGLVARGVQPSEIHYEVFGPDKWLAAS